MTAALLAFAGFAALVILHEFGHFVAAKSVGMRVERFSLFFPPLIAKVRRGETEYAIGAVPLGGYVKITGMNPNEELPPEVAPRAYYRQAVWKRIVVIGAGPAVNIALAFLILWALFWADGVQRTDIGVRAVEKGSPAAQVLRPGDLILSIDGAPGYAPDQSNTVIEDRLTGLTAAVAKQACAGGAKTDGCRAEQPTNVVVLRDGERMTIPVRGFYDAELKRMRLGFSFGVDSTRPVGPAEAADLGVSSMWNVTTLTLDRLGKIFVSSKARKDVSGVVGSYEATRQSFEFDTAQALRILALISLSLGIINLFPFLPLDGGHIFWAVAEKIRGRPIPFSVLERASVIGIMLVALLFVIGLSNDIGRITSGEGFGVR
jgi:regulator of sigma E protease